MHDITPCLWFDHQAEEAVNFYLSIFPNSRITQIARYGKAGPGQEGHVMTIAFELDGRPFVALNGGPIFKFTEAVSFQVFCDTQERVDHFWNRLSKDGTEVQCGWLKDKHGLSWQIVPRALPAMMADPDPARVRRVAEAMFKMVKLDIAGLTQAYSPQ
jgi:predicted 3-demethylubiquinone-9 3-methyltransferase (glyoxalase superfamily)